MLVRPPVRCLSGAAFDDGPRNELAGGRGVPLLLPGMCPSGSAGNDGLLNILDGGRGVLKIPAT